MRPLIASIDLSALQHNFRLVRQLAPHSKVFAVVKADAYGHGAVQCAQALSFSDGFAVATIEEAIQLRAAQITKPLMVLSAFSQADEIELLVDHKLIPVIHSLEQLNLLLNHRSLNETIRCWLKVDTGMNRLGLTHAELKLALEKLAETTYLNAVGIMSHFACADELNNTLSKQQLDKFKTLANGLSFARSMANSAAILAWPESHYQWVRPGLMLYGISPINSRCSKKQDLKPVMHFKSQLMSIRQLAAGQGVGYGHKFVASRPMRIGVVSCGYADGYPRQAKSGTHILVDGVQTRTLGAISMDTMSIDITDLPQVKVNSKVTFWGPGLPVEEVAESISTIPYELICRLGTRVKREYLGG